MQPIRVILVPFDFSEQAEAALDVAITLAQPLEADLHLVHVVPPASYAFGSEFLTLSSVELPDLRSDAERRLQDVADELPRSIGNVEAHVLEGMRVADAISRLAECIRVDLIVMGTHGRTGLAHVLRGSIAERTLRRAPCPVLTVPTHELGWQSPAHVDPTLGASLR